MKLFAAVLIVAFIAVAHGLSDEQKEKVRAYCKECKEQTKVDQAILDKAKKGEFEDDPKFKEFLFCFLKKANFLDEAGEYKLDVIRTKVTSEIGEEAAEKLIKACVDKSYGNGPQTAYELKKCAHANAPKDYSLFKLHQ